MRTILRMRPPSKREAKGYDIVIWVDKDGDVVTRAFTEKGHAALQGLVNKYERGDIVQIYGSPEDFEAEMPEGLAIGLLTPQGMRPMHAPHLH